MLFTQTFCSGICALGSGIKPSAARQRASGIINYTWFGIHFFRKGKIFVTFSDTLCHYEKPCQQKDCLASSCVNWVDMSWSLDWQVVLSWYYHEWQENLINNLDFSTVQ